MNEALEKGSVILKNGGSVLDAAEASVKTLEDNPLFNAGKGSVFTNDGKNELDAAIMNGKTTEPGSVAGVKSMFNSIFRIKSISSEGSP